MGFFTRAKEEQEIEFSSIILGGKEVNFTLVRKENIRNISFQINPTRGLRITIPYRSDMSKVYDLIYEKEDWIIKHLEKVKQVSKKPGTISILGKEYSFSIVETIGREKVVLDNDKVFVHVKHPRNVNKVLEKWYRTQAKEIIPTIVDKYSKYFNSRIGTVTIKGQKTRWGSCSSQNNLNFNWKLVMAPQEIIDYVVIHELSHTVHHNHSERFWNLVSQLDPNYKKNRKWLKDNGQNLALD